MSSGPFLGEMGCGGGDEMGIFFSGYVLGGNLVTVGLDSP